MDMRIDMVAGTRFDTCIFMLANMYVDISGGLVHDKMKAELAHPVSVRIPV